MSIICGTTLHPDVNKNYSSVSYRKQIARQHSLSTVWNVSSHIIWSPFKIWLLDWLWGTLKPQSLGRWHDWLHRNTPLPTCGIIPNYVGQTVWRPKQFGDSGTLFLGTGTWMTRTPPVLPYQFLSFKVKPFWAYVRGSKILGTLGPCRLGIGVWLSHRNTLLPHLCYHTKFYRSRANRK